MIILFDFDHTLFDKNKFFEKDLPDFIGVDRKKFIKIYNEFFKDPKTKQVNYDLEKHLDILGINNNQTRKKVEQFLGRASQYLKLGALDLLKNYQARGDEMYLVTFGNTKWQKTKVDQIKELDEFFNGRHKKFLEKDKYLALDFLKNKKEEIIIINDKPRESLKMAESLKKKFKKNVRLFIVKSVYSNNSSYQGKIYRDLRQLTHGLFSGNDVELKN